MAYQGGPPKGATGRLEQQAQALADLLTNAGIDATQATVRQWSTPQGALEDVARVGADYVAAVPGFLDMSLRGWTEGATGGRPQPVGPFEKFAESNWEQMSPGAKMFSIFGDPGRAFASGFKAAAVLPAIMSKADKVSTLRLPRFVAREGATGEDLTDTLGELLFQRIRPGRSEGQFRVTDPGPGDRSFNMSEEDLLREFPRDALERADLVSPRPQALDATPEQMHAITEYDTRSGYYPPEPPSSRGVEEYEGGVGPTDQHVTTPQHSYTPHQQLARVFAEHEGQNLDFDDVVTWGRDQGMSYRDIAESYNMANSFRPAGSIPSHNYYNLSGLAGFEELRPIQRQKIERVLGTLEDPPEPYVHLTESWDVISENVRNRAERNEDLVPLVKRLVKEADVTPEQVRNLWFGIRFGRESRGSNEAYDRMSQATDYLDDLERVMQQYDLMPTEAHRAPELLEVSRLSDAQLQQVIASGGRDIPSNVDYDNYVMELERRGLGPDIDALTSEAVNQMEASGQAIAPRFRNPQEMAEYYRAVTTIGDPVEIDQAVGEIKEALELLSAEELGDLAGQFMNEGNIDLANLAFTVVMERAERGRGPR